MKYDIVAIGSATRDVYISSNDLVTVSSDELRTGKGICVPAGSKVNVEDIHFTTGGSAVNTAVTFGQQGLNTGVIAKVGDDSRGLSIEKRLMEVGVDTSSIVKDPDHMTAYSVIAHSEGGERTIFVYRGSSSYFYKDEFPFDVLKQTQWIFVTHLGGESAELFAPLLEQAHESAVKVALNPGSTQLEMGTDLQPFLEYVDILFVNQEEAALLTDVDYNDEKGVFAKLDELMDGLAVMTKGPKGVVVSDGENRWDAPALEEPKFIDRTGAGDAFASGFTTAVINGGDVEDAIQLGSANATGGVTKWGSNHGLLSKDDSPEKFGKLDIKKSKL